MNKPDQYKLDAAREVLEYLIAVTTALEPYATATIASLEDALANIPNEDDLEDMPNG